MNIPARFAGLALAIAPIATFGAVSGVITAAAPRAEAQQGADDLALIQRHIRAVTTLAAGFAQTDRNGQVQTGKLLWKQPGHIRFQYAQQPLLIVADGRSLNMIDYEVAQVQRWPIRNSPLGALLDPSRDLTRYGTLVPTGDARVLSLDVRDPDHPEYGVINLVLQRKAGAPAGLQLHGWVAKDAQGNRTTIRLSDHDYGVPIADSAFRWRDPRPNLPGPRR